MAYRDIKKRIEQLQIHSKPEYIEILKLIDEGKRYDQLTEEQKDLYYAYLGEDREAAEQIKDMIYDRKAGEDQEPYNWRHDPIERKAPPIPKDRQDEFIKMRAEEIRAYLDNIPDDLDQDEKEQRQSEWSEICEQREAAFRSGRKWKDYPLPEWAKADI